MRLLTSRTVWVVLALVSLVGFAAAQQSPAEKTAEQVFKNIQVFKGKPANELRPTMDFIASSLGVHCSFCHNTRDFSSDAKPTKRRARQMVEMVFAINKSTFGGRNEVNCYTCHQGSPHPNGRLSVASLVATSSPGVGGKVSGEGRMQADRSKLPAAKAIVDKYVAAIGGAGALAAVHSETVQAERVARGRSTPVTLTRAQGKLLLVNGTAKSGYTGTQFWSSGRRGTNLNPESSTVAQLRADLPLYPAAGLDAAKARVFGIQTVNGQKAYVVAVRTDHGFNSYAFDTETGLLLRYSTGAPTFLGTLPLEINYSDYRQVGAIKLPFAVTFATHESHWERKVSAVKLNPSVDAVSFAAPSKK